MNQLKLINYCLQISQLVADLRGAKFSLDPSEEEAGKIVKELLHQYASASCPARESAPEAIQDAMLMLKITTPKALVIERRSIKMLLGKVGECNPPKKKILLFFLNLLNKYENKIQKEKSENNSVQLDDPFPSAGSDAPSIEVESPVKHGAGDADSPPNEFKCPISSRLMYDPVVIASGETYERKWIQRWFDEGNDTCPKTGMGLTHFSLTPNNSMKDLISKWCAESGVAPSDPNMQTAAVPHPWELSSVSIASLGSSMNDLRLPIDFSNLSLGSADSSSPKITNYANVLSTKAYGNSHISRTSASMNEMGMESLYSLESLSWKSQCNMVEKIKNVLQHNDRTSKQISSENFVQPLMRFLNVAHDLQDENAQILGCQLLLTFLKKCR